MGYIRTVVTRFHMIDPGSRGAPAIETPSVLAADATRATTLPGSATVPSRLGRRSRDDGGTARERAAAAHATRARRPRQLPTPLSIRVLARPASTLAGPAALPVLPGSPAVPILMAGPQRAALAIPGLAGPTVIVGRETLAPSLPRGQRRGADGVRERASAIGDLDLSVRPALRLPRRRTLLFAIILGLPLAVLAVRFRAEVEHQLADIPAPNWPWLLVCGGGATLYYVSNGLALRAGSGLPLGVRVATSVQCAAAAANRIIPAGLGAIAVNLRFLERRGLSRPAAVATIASLRVACGLVHLAALALVAALLGDSRITASLTGPLRDTMSSLGLGPVCIGVGAAVAVLAVVLTRRRVRDRLRGPLATFRAHLRDLAHSPGRAAVLTGSLAGTKVAQVIALTAGERAFGGDVSVLSVAAVYLVGSTVAGAAPTAGNVGAIEPALAIGLTAAGGPAASMVAAVLVYRLITYWLPVVPGVIALTALRRRGDL